MKRIAVLVETSLASGRQILSGIARYLQHSQGISIFHLSGQLGEMNPAAIVDWKGDGIIARVLSPAIADLLEATGLPTVDVLGNVDGRSFPLVKCNNGAIGSMVANSFIESGFRHFGVIGLSGTSWSIDREAAFQKEAARRDGSQHSLHLKATDSELVHITDTMHALRKWLPSLPKPIGLFVTSDQFAPLLFEVAHELKMRIPEDISVIGVDNDAPYCELCQPALSSVAPNHEEVGYTAAQLLDRIIMGQKLDLSLHEIDPLMIYLRRSSSALAVDDPQLASALRHIRTRACENPSIDEVARVCGLSRSVLQRRFRAQLNRSVGETILNEKLSRAKQLLYTSRLSVDQIAEQSGFNCQEYMSHIFRKHLKQSPSRFRKRL